MASKRAYEAPVSRIQQATEATTTQFDRSTFYHPNNRNFGKVPSLQDAATTITYAQTVKRQTPEKAPELPSFKHITLKARTPADKALIASIGGK